MFVISRVK